MTKEECIAEYNYQQTEAGMKAVEACENMIEFFVNELHIPRSAFKSPRIRPLINATTGEWIF